MDLALSCSCGCVKGVARQLKPLQGLRITCCCADCQAFAVYLGHEQTVLDEYGGTDVVQIPPSQLVFTQGADQLRCLKLTPKGLHRWYTACCQSPIGNTLTPGIPHVGVISSFLVNPHDADTAFGSQRCYVNIKHAQKWLPPELKPGRYPWRLLFKAAFTVLRWRVQGKHQPSPFFNTQGHLVVKPLIVNPPS